MKKLLIKVLMLILVVAAITETVNLIYMHNYENFGTMGNCKNSSSCISDVPESIDICCFGNSHPFFAFCFDDYTDDYSCFNFALTAQTLSYDYRILSEYKDNISSGAIVFIGISQNSFFVINEQTKSDFASKNKRYYRFLSPDNIKEYSLLSDITINYFPALDAGIPQLLLTLIGKTYNADEWNCVINSDEIETQAKGRYSGLVLGNKDDTLGWEVNAEELDAVYNIIDVCKEIGATPILITTPYMKEYAELVVNNTEYYEKQQSIIQEICEKTGVKYYNYELDERFSTTTEYFTNIDHLNHAGAKVFTQIVFNEIVSTYKEKEH